MAKFEELFKPGDIICSDRFYAGKCLLVDTSHIRFDGEFVYKCDDLVLERQRWVAVEFDLFDKPNNWRIATDEDIVKNLARHVRVKVGQVGNYDAFLDDETLILRHMAADDFVYLNAEQLVQLKQIIEERVEV